MQAGDKRILVSEFEGKPIVVLYDYKAPEVPAASRVGFSSPWRTVWVDRVKVLENAAVSVSRHGANVTVEGTIPWSAIGFDPSQVSETLGDVGRVNSDATGTRAASRTYWSNKNTAIMSDLPTEVWTEPDLWGTFRF